MSELLRRVQEHEAKKEKIAQEVVDLLQEQYGPTDPKLDELFAEIEKQMAQRQAEAKLEEDQRMLDELRSKLKETEDSETHS